MTQPIIEDLGALPAFQGLSEETLTWLASRMELRELAPGDILFREGDPADYLWAVLAGEIRASREMGGESGRILTLTSGMVSGMLPYSRLTTYPLTSRATMPTRVAFLHRSEFPVIAHRFPELQGRLVNVMSDRIREVTSADQQRDKLMALGKLSAGLAHELNNPAAAARRAAQNLRAAVESLRAANARLDALDLTPAQRRRLSEIETETAERDEETLTMDTLERSDREQQVGDWLDERGTSNAWELAPDLVDAGVTQSCLIEIAEDFPPEAMNEAMIRVAASNTIRRLVDEIDHSAERISDLVKAVKEYSYMDRMPEQEVDVHNGLESTLLMMKHRWKGGIEIIREYDRSIPAVCAKGNELNQVWTNLIDNAIDAMKGQGVLRLRTALEFDCALVEIGDNGPGVPAEIQSKIFDPFFTTKPVGEGTGLGLDAAYRIVRSHRGSIQLISSPGDTRFQVRLPVAK